MGLVTIYSILLLGGMFISQLFDLARVQDVLVRATTICLAYIMIEVGLEFTVNKKQMKSYAFDYFVAATAAGFPWIFCAIYFMFFLNLDWKESLLIGRFAAPTSAGVLFTMLAAAGLGTTWLFRKARVLAVFDDLDTILFMIPLKVMFVGLRYDLIVVVPILLALLAVGFKWLHFLRLPIGKPWLLMYGAAVVYAAELLEHTTKVHLEILLPAFIMGCILFNPHDPQHPVEYAHEHRYLEPTPPWAVVLDRLLKGLFMFFVGCSLPKIVVQNTSLGVIFLHVLAVTVISNLGKCFPLFCYRRSVDLRHRLALSIAMFPRGEVGAGVLLVAMGYGLDGFATTISVLSLALNLLLTGVFITIVIQLIHPAHPHAAGHVAEAGKTEK